jgi:hypothetical protein
LRKRFLQPWQLESKEKRMAREKLMVKQMVDEQREGVYRDAGVGYE